MKINTPSRLSDEELTAEVKRLAGSERGITIDLIIHLAEFDKRRLYLPAGFASLFTYCREVLRLSEHAAYHRIVAARTARRFPAVLRMLAEGALNLTSVRLLAPHLTAGNHEELFAAASGKSKREVQELLARRFPQPDVEFSVRKLPAPSLSSEPAPAPAGTACATLTAASSRELPPLAAPTVAASTPARPIAPLPPSHRPPVTPLAADRYQIAFTASTETRDKLELAQDLMRHAIPSGDTAAIFDAALTALLEKLAREKFAATDWPRTSRGTAKGSDDIPASVKRVVWVRDLGRCAFVSKDSRRCNERSFVQFHHVVPRAVGGPATAANVQLSCRAHNDYEADRYYGPRAPEGVVCEPPAPYGTSIPWRSSVRTELSHGHSNSTATGRHTRLSYLIMAVSRSHTGPSPASRPA